LNELPNSNGGHRSGLTRDFASVFEDGKGGNGADAMLPVYAGQVVGVYFDDKPSPCALGRHLGEFGRDHFAGAAPWRPEVNQDRERGASGEGHKCGVIFHVDWLAWGRKVSMTLAAAESLAETFVIHSVALATVRAAQEQTALVTFNGVNNGVHGRFLGSGLFCSRVEA